MTGGRVPGAARTLEGTEITGDGVARPPGGGRGVEPRRVDRRAVVIGVGAAGAGAIAAAVGLAVTQTSPEPAVERTAPVAGATKRTRPTPSPTPSRIQRSPVLDVTRYGADPTGARDSAPALRRALAALGSSGGTIAFPAGTFRIRATAAAPFLSLPARAVVRGASAGRTVLRLESDDPAGYREFARPIGDDVVLQDLTVRRSGTFPCVLLNLPPVRGFTLSRVTIDGAFRGGDANYCHGLQLAAFAGTASGLRIEDSAFTRCTSCTLITNDATGTVRDVVIDGCRMQNIDFNAPKATVRGIRIRDCVVDAAGSEYFGIAFAHVTDAVVSNTTIRRAQKEAIHIEDACSDVTITRCTLERSALGATDAFAYIQIINASRGITIDRCLIDARGSRSRSDPSLIAVQQGGEGVTDAGRTFAPPRDVAITRNRLLTDGLGVRTGIYLERVPGATISGNRLTGGGSVAHGAYSGASDVAVDLIQPTRAQVADNTIDGWRTALVGQGDGGGRTRFLRNAVVDCDRVVRARGVTVAGTRAQRVVTR